MTFDGAGNFSGSDVHNNDGTISSAAVSGTDAVAADGTLSISRLGATIAGGLSPNGNTFVASQTTSTFPPGVLVGIKQGQSNFSNANLIGTYTTVRYDYDPLGDRADLSTITFDGAGNFSGTDTLNNTGTVSNMAIAGTYTVAAHGTLTLSPVGGSTVTGGLSADGNTLVTSQTNAGVLAEILVGIKQGPMKLSNANLMGTYKIANYTYINNLYIPGSGEFGADSGGLSTVTFDGAGNFSGGSTRDNTGMVSSMAVAGTYTVAADGTLTVSPIGGSTVTGSLGADGSTLVFAQMTSGDAPSVSFGVRL